MFTRLWYPTSVVAADSGGGSGGGGSKGGQRQQGHAAVPVAAGGSTRPQLQEPLLQAVAAAGPQQSAAQAAAPPPQSAGASAALPGAAAAEAAARAQAQRLIKRATYYAFVHHRWAGRTSRRELLRRDPALPASLPQPPAEALTTCAHGALALAARTAAADSTCCRPTALLSPTPQGPLLHQGLQDAQIPALTLCAPHLKRLGALGRLPHSGQQPRPAPAAAAACGPLAGALPAGGAPPGGLPLSWVLPAVPARRGRPAAPARRWVAARSSCSRTPSRAGPCVWRAAYTRMVLPEQGGPWALCACCPLAAGLLARLHWQLRPEHRPV
jgi:hypothetical protein